MKMLDTLLASSVIQTFGWALLHSLWQGIILAILLKSTLSLSKKLSANTRYLIACITLFLMLVLPVSTAFWSNLSAINIGSSKAQIQIAEPNVKSTTTPDAVLQNNASETEFSYDLWLQQGEKQFLPWLVLIWLFGVVISSLRLIGAWSYTQRLKLNGKNLVLEHYTETIQKLSRQLRISKPVLLLESALVKVPTVIGWVKPVILIPPSALIGLSPQQFELILTHELAHIRRHDYLVNLFQTIIETLLFYHPAVWWASVQIRNERENACDDLAVSLSSDPVVYARTLIEMERLRKAVPSLAMAADGGSLTGRIHRLMGVEMPDSKRFAGIWAVLFISLFMLIIGGSRLNSSLIKESVGDALSLNFSSLTNSATDKRITEETKLETTEAGEKNKKITEEKTRVIQPFENEPDSKAMLNTGQKISIEPFTDQETVEQASRMSKDNSFTEQAHEVTSGIDETANLQKNIGYQKENKPVQQNKSQDYIDEMASVGYANLSADELIKLKRAEVTADFVRSLQAFGFANPTVKELVSMGTHGVTPAYIQSIRAAGYNNLSLKELISFRFKDITPESIGALRRIGYVNLDVKQLKDFSFHDVTPDFNNEIRAVGYSSPSARELVSLRFHDVTPEFIRKARTRKGELTLQQIISLKRAGVLDDEKDKG
jgi:beta-lactamase regulating signal transducer with metallopeptidase domain